MGFLDKETFARGRTHHANFVLLDWQIDAPHSNIASSWYAQARKLRKLQHQIVLLNRLAKEYEILQEGANLSVEIVQEFLTAGHFFENLVPSCWPFHLNTTKNEKS